MPHARGLQTERYETSPSPGVPPLPPPAARERSGLGCSSRAPDSVKGRKNLFSIALKFPRSLSTHGALKPWQKISKKNTVKVGPWQEKANVT